MVIVYNTAVRTDGHVYASLFIILIPGLCHLNQGRGLSSSDSLLFTGNTDGAAANSHFDKISSCLCQEPESVSVHNIAGSYLHRIPKILPDVVNGNLLPLREAFGAVNAQHIRSRVQQGRHTLFIVPCIDTCSHHIPLGAVNEFVLILFMGVIVLTENQVHQLLVLIHQRKAVNLVLPDNIIGFLQGS